MQFIFVLALIIVLLNCTGACEDDPKRAAERADELERYHATQTEGARALLEVDVEIAKSNERVRKEFETKARSHEMHSRGPVRIDVYTMPDGRVVTCETVVYETGPLLNCDGEP